MEGIMLVRYRLCFMLLGGGVTTTIFREGLFTGLKCHARRIMSEIGSAVFSS